MANRMMIAAAVGAVLVATTAAASAQYRAFPGDRYYYGYGYYGGPVYGPNYWAVPAPFAPGYYDYAPAPGPYYDYWNGWTYDRW